MLSLFTASAGLLANGVQPMAPATRLAAPMMKTSGVKVVVPDKCVACPHCSCPHCPGKYTGAETVCVCHSTDVEPWHNAGVLSAGVLPASGQLPPIRCSALVLIVPSQEGLGLLDRRGGREAGYHKLWFQVRAGDCDCL